METSLEIFPEQQEVKINCQCGTKFWVGGNIPVKVICHSCDEEINMRLALKVLKYPESIFAQRFMKKVTK